MTSYIVARMDHLSKFPLQRFSTSHVGDKQTMGRSWKKNLFGCESLLEVKVALFEHVQCVVKKQCFWSERTG